jgi:putative DNA primase/helicase
MEGKASSNHAESTASESREAGDSEYSAAEFVRPPALVPPPQGNEDVAPSLSEEALAIRFSRLHHDLRYVREWRRWMVWDGNLWRKDRTLEAFNRARAICREASSDSDANERRSLLLASKQCVAAIERLAQADRRHAATPEQWDRDQWALNTPAGTVDLKTGTLRKHRLDDYITKSTATAPGGKCELWLKFLERITNSDAELQSFLKRMVGYSITGITSEQSMFFLYGSGANGKSVFLSTIAGMLGDYARTAPVSILTASNTEQHPTDLAGLQGFRFVTAIETEEGRWWAEAKIKSLTGGDRIAARFMRQDFIEFTPVFKLFVAGNHKPGLRNVDPAIQRRLRLIPFTVTIPEQERDPNLLDKLKSEYEGILHWAIEGCLEWQRMGLDPPPAVSNATADYLASEDTVGRWIDECCVCSTGLWTPGSKLYASFQQWCERTGERQWSQKRFSQALKTRGFERERTGAIGARGFSGIATRSGHTADTSDTYSASGGAKL